MPPRSTAMRLYDSLVAMETSAVRKRQALDQHHELVEQVSPAELGFVELGIDVVVVEDEPLAQNSLKNPPTRKIRSGGLQAWMTSKPWRRSTRNASANSQKSAVAYSSA